MTMPETKPQPGVPKPPQEDLAFLRRLIWFMAAKMILLVGVTVGVLWYAGIF